MVEDVLRLRPFARRVNLTALMKPEHRFVCDADNFDLNRAVYRDAPVEKLDVILYANCTLKSDDSALTVPPAVHIRNISNKEDMVARLGIRAEEGWIARWFGLKFDADLPDRHECRDGCGHLLNEHYLL